MNAFEANRCWLRRKARTEHPHGSFESGRWWPSVSEVRECCSSIRRPSRQWPYGLLTHCRSAVHIAQLHGVTCRALQIAGYLIEQEYESEELLTAIEATEKIKGKELSKQQILKLAKRFQISKEAA